MCSMCLCWYGSILGASVPPSPHLTTAYSQHSVLELYLDRKDDLLEISHQYYVQGNKAVYICSCISPNKHIPLCLIPLWRGLSYLICSVE